MAFGLGRLETAMAAAVAADPWAPIRSRTAASCILHRQRWSLHPWPPDDAGVRRAYGRRRREVLALAALYREAAP